MDLRTNKERDTQIGFSVAALILIIAVGYMILYPSNQSPNDSYSTHRATVGPFSPPGSAKIYR